jgi:hypothetical protein
MTIKRASMTIKKGRHDAPFVTLTLNEVKGKGLVVTKNACQCKARPPFVARPFRVVHEAKASHYIFKLCSVILPFDF